MFLKFLSGKSQLILVLLAAFSAAAGNEPEPEWKNFITYPSDPFESWTFPAYIKFTIITKADYDPNIVYYQDSKQYEYHYEFALDCLEPFIDMTVEQFDDVSLHKTGQQAVLGAVIMPPWADPPISEYGIQFVRDDPYTREEVLRLFNIVKASVIAEPNVTAYYFPTYEQYPMARQNIDWLETQGIPVGSMARWTKENVCYSNGWALGRLKSFAGGEIRNAFIAGDLSSQDIVLTDGVPAELPTLAGIISLTPATPNSHVAILARSQGVPFVSLGLEQDITLAQSLVGHDVYLAVTNESYGLSNAVKLLDVANLSDADKASILVLKWSPSLEIQPVRYWGGLWADTNDLQPADICYVGGKAANFGILRRAIPYNSTPAMAFSFDLWNAFLDQTLPNPAQIVLAPGEHVLIWADDDPEQGPFHAGFKLSRLGEDVGLFDRDGRTLIDSVSFGPQRTDVSYGRSIDGGGLWQLCENPSPGAANSQTGDMKGLVINELMADNKKTIQDPAEPGEYPDWIELYNGSDETVILNGLFLTDDLNEPTKWAIPPSISGATIREEIVLRLSKYTEYSSVDMEGLSSDLFVIRNLLTDSNMTAFSEELEDEITSALEVFGFDPAVNIRFRSSTNVEDSDQFIGAGLYDSYSGCLADDLDDDDDGPCTCDTSDINERGVFRAIRKVFASFYNDNAFLERLRYGINEAETGMALLVHHSFPDEIELANGVATMQRSGELDWIADIISQKGAVSVTNPPADAVPEQVRIDYSPFWGISPMLVSRSSLVPLRENTVLEWEQEYIELYELLLAAAEQYCIETEKECPLLDFEFKKTAPEGRLIIKQIREVPQSAAAEYNTPFLLGQSRSYQTLQGRGSDVFTNHRLKSRWILTHKNLWLSVDNLHESIYADAQIEYVANGQVRQVSTELSLLPEAGHTYEEPQDEWERYSITDTWSFTNLCSPRTYRLRTEPVFQSVLSDPVVTPDDLRLSIEVEYAAPVLLDEPNTTTIENTTLYQPWEPSDQDYLEVCSFVDPNIGVSIDTQFYVRWSMMGPTPTSVQFEQTRIEGLTTEPIVLTGYYSQSIGGGAHLCPKNFLFEPALEPEISQEILDELESRNIRLIYYTTGARDCRPTEWKDSPPQIKFYGFDDVWDCVVD
jgi:hypothetical protein